MDIKLITIENSKVFEIVVGQCTLANYDEEITKLANQYFGTNWEWRRITPHALTRYIASDEGDVLTID